jgi:hypothetical protein
MKPLFLTFATLTLFAAALPAAQSGAETKIGAKDLPAPVRAAFEKQYPGAKILSASKEIDKGVTLYEVESVQNGRNRDVLYKPSGEVVVVEETIAMSEVPAAVQAALKAHFPQAQAVKAEKLISGSTVEYEFQLKGAAKKEVKFSAGGKLLATE